MTPDKSQGARPTRRGSNPKGSASSRRTSVILTVALLAAVVLIGAAMLRSNSGDVPDANPNGATASQSRPPWPPRQEGLQAAVEAAGFPPVGDESYHVHALLSVFVDGEPVIVPANIGIDTTTGYHSPLHTHTPDGVIHFEADEPAAFTLGQFFTMWGVDFSAQRLGALTPQGDNSVQVYVNGSLVEDPETYAINEGDNVVVAYGAPGSFPTEPPTDALDGA